MCSQRLKVNKIVFEKKYTLWIDGTGSASVAAVCPWMAFLNF